jgi:hypothetical protein
MTTKDLREYAHLIHLFKKRGLIRMESSSGIEQLKAAVARMKELKLISLPVPGQENTPPPPPSRDPAIAKAAALERKREIMRRIRQQRKESGLCVRCAKPSNGSTVCLRCRKPGLAAMEMVS